MHRRRGGDSPRGRSSRAGGARAAGRRRNRDRSSRPRLAQHILQVEVLDRRRSGIAAAAQLPRGVVAVERRFGRSRSSFSGNRKRYRRRASTLFVRARRPSDARSSVRREAGLVRDLRPRAPELRRLLAPMATLQRPAPRGRRPASRECSTARRARAGAASSPDPRRRERSRRMGRRCRQRSRRNSTPPGSPMALVPRRRQRRNTRRPSGAPSRPNGRRTSTWRPRRRRSSGRRTRARATPLRRLSSSSTCARRQVGRQQVVLRQQLDVAARRLRAGSDSSCLRRRGSAGCADR